MFNTAFFRGESNNLISNLLTLYHSLIITIIYLYHSIYRNK